MKGKIIIPKPPKPYKIKGEVKENLEKWITYFRELSPRILVKLTSDQDFNLEMYKSKVEEAMEISDMDRKLIGWPELNQVAFLISFNSSLPGHEPAFLIKDSYLFCYYDVAFGLEYFEWEGGEEDSVSENYSLSAYSKEALSWSYIAKLIKDKIIKIEKSIVSVP